MLASIYILQRLRCDRFLWVLVVYLLAACTYLPMAYSQQIVAHRGASYDAPENTLAAFRLAFEQDADGIEGDFYVTSDNQIVCIHDKDTARTAGKRLVIADSTLEQLKTLDVGSWRGAQFANERIPTFEEVLAVVPDNKRFVIELKTGPEIVPLLKAKLDEADLGRRKLLIIAFNVETAIASKSQLPDVPVHWLTGFEQEKGSWTPSAESIIETVARIKADGVGMQGKRQVVDEAFVNKLKNAGIKEFHFWTIDNPQDAVFFKSLGAFGITTNRPAFIRQHLSRK